MGVKNRLAPLVTAAAVTLAAATVIAQPTAPAQAVTPPMQPRAEVDALTAILLESVGVSDTRRRDRTLTGLRKLRDPSTLALFSQLSINSSPMLRVHGLLGLAELEPQRGLDLLAVSRVPDPRLQGVIIYEALAEGLISEETITELSSWQTLPARVRLDLAASCAARSRPFSITCIETLLPDPDAFNAVAAAVVLKQAGADLASSDQTIHARAAGLALDSGSQAEDFAAFVIEHRLTAAAGALGTLAKTLKPGPAAEAVAAALLVTSPEDNGVLNAAKARLDIAVPAQSRASFAVRFLDVSLKLGKATPRVIIAEMTTDPDPLVKSIGAVTHAIADDQASIGPSVAALALRGHVPSVAWALRCAAERHWQDSRTIRLAIVDGIAKRPKGSLVDPQLAAMAENAVTALVDDDPRVIDRPLGEAISAGDAVLVRIMLEGTLRSVHADAGALVRQGAFDARPAGPWPDKETAALALLVAVRHGEFASDPVERAGRLSAIARGEGGGAGLGGVLRAQAAWLALHASGEDRVALTRILSDLPAPAADTPVWTVPPQAPPPQQKP